MKLNGDLFAKRCAPASFLLAKKFDEINSRCQFHQHFMSSFFGTKVECADFWYLKFGRKAALKMLVLQL